MRLVNIGNDTYVNIDLTVSIYRQDDTFHLNINDVYKSHYVISEEAYNSILSYGKAKV